MYHKVGHKTFKTFFVSTKSKAYCKRGRMWSHGRGRGLPEEVRVHTAWDHTIRSCWQWVWSWLLVGVVFWRACVRFHRSLFTSSYSIEGAELGIMWQTKSQCTMV